MSGRVTAGSARRPTGVSRHSQRGIALITAIILVAIAAVLATSIGFNSLMVARRSALEFSAEQAMLVSEGAEAMAAYALRQNLTNHVRQDLPDQPWAQPYGPLPIAPGVTLQFAQIDDEQSKFNLNNLAPGGVPSPIAIQQFQRLLMELNLEPTWAPKMAAWVGASQQAGSGGAGDSTYLAQNPPYREAKLPITSISELLELPAFGHARYVRLAPYVTALPPGPASAVNICTASGVVLDALSGQMEYSLDPGTLAMRRKSGGCFPGMEAYQASFSAQALAQVGKYFGVRSSYFRLRTIVTIGSARFTLYSLLYRDAGGEIRPIIRTFGTE